MGIKKRIQGVLLAFCLGMSICCSGCKESNVSSIELERASDNESNDEIQEKKKESGAGNEKKAAVVSGGSIASQPIVVYVCGAVNVPGVYTLAPSSRMSDAVAAAGGMSPQADANVLNLAQFLTDGQMIRIPLQGEVLALEDGSQAGESQSGQDSDGKININTADAAQLMSIPGVGQAKADAIIRYRKEQGAFQSVEDIMQVEGIKEGSFAKMKDYICTE